MLRFGLTRLARARLIAFGNSGVSAALSLNFLSGTLDSRITFTRASTATFVGSNGLIQSAAINAARFDYTTGGAARGLLIEELRTNLFLNSDIAGTALSTQSVTVAATPYTISFYGTGTITLSGTAVATITGAAVYPARQTLTFTPTAGTLTCTVTGSVQYAQCEAGSFVTSFVPTAGATVTRSADFASMAGTNFSSWFNASAGTFVVAWDALNPSLTNGTMSVSDNTANNRMDMRTSYASFITSGGVTYLSYGPGTAAANTTYKSAIAYQSADFVSAFAGAIVATGAAGAVPVVNQLLIGNLDTAGANYQTNGHIRSITYYNTRKTNSELVVLST